MSNASNQKQPNLSKSLSRKGLIILIASFVINTIFIAAGIGGLLHEAARLGVIVGFLMVIVGLVQRARSKKK